MSWLETGACLQKPRVLESLILGPERKTLFLREELGVTLTFLGIQELHGQKKLTQIPDGWHWHHHLVTTGIIKSQFLRIIHDPRQIGKDWEVSDDKPQDILGVRKDDWQV